MLNQIVLVGRVKEVLENKVYIAVVRSYKNEEGCYDTDIIPISFDDNIMDNVKTYCQIGDIVGIKGRIEQVEDEIVIKGSKVTYLSSKGGE